MIYAVILPLGVVSGLVAGAASVFLSHEGCPLGVAFVGGLVYAIAWPVLLPFVLVALFVNLIQSQEA